YVVGFTCYHYLYFDVELCGDSQQDDADDEEEEESSDSEEEEEEHLASTVPAPALYASEETEPFEEGETAATPPPFGYRLAARIYVQPHILMPFCLESEIMDYYQSREVHTSTLVTQMEALHRDVSTLQRHHIEHAQRDVAPEDGDSCS
nr:hypothetical protein [Tanacetum cinerariifolium]